ncbi:MAG: sugar kinase, partial [Gemmataceae bacterium]|nr:sugar kinase [Gemmataceae bacterium]
MAGLQLRSDRCELDFLALGALVHRLDPGVVPFRKARAFDVHVSGGEYNVAANLADCFGRRTGIATAMVRYPIGDLVQARVRETGVVPFYKWFDHDGVRGPNIATVYSDRGYGVRPPIVFYNRANEAGAMLQPGDFDWGSIFAGGVRWFHSGGIFASLGPRTADLIIEGMQAARATGAVVSFDLNYRAKLWASVGGPARAHEVLRRIAVHVDALIGNEEDLQKGLGIEDTAGAAAAEN